MSIINSHDISLYGGNSMDIVLSPLHDNHLPLLYRWNSDPEVVYWSDTGNTNQFSEEEVRGMYAYISANALCFLITVDGTPVGDLWLQKMNLPEISAKYPHMDMTVYELAEINYLFSGLLCGEKGYVSMICRTFSCRKRLNSYPFNP